MAIMVSSCTKDTGGNEKSAPPQELDAATKKRIDEVTEFTMQMKNQTESRATGNKITYTPEEFTKNTEESINLDYSEPFVRYWDVETKIDSFDVPLVNCTIDRNVASTWYNIIFDKVRCHYNCSNLSNKELKVVTVTIKEKDCAHFKALLYTAIGSETVTPDANMILENEGDPNGGSETVGKKKFNTSLWGSWGSCSIPNPPLTKHTATILTGYATYNIVGGTAPGYSIINAEFKYLTSHLTPETGWWSMWCFDPPHEEDNCGATINCSMYFQPHPQFPPQSGVLNYNAFTPAGEDQYCLNKYELNAILGTTETYCKNEAAAAGKQFIDVWGEWRAGSCSDLNHHWYGYLTIGKKVPRIIKRQLLHDPCQCN